MELLSSASLSSYSSFTRRPPSPASKDLCSSFAVIRISKKPAFTGLKLPTATLRQCDLRSTAVDGHAICDASNDSTSKNEEQSYPRANPESGEETEDDEMVRVYDKLIDVFLVDKPSPTDWRRMIAFSREWNSFRSEFFKRLQERAESEENPDLQLNLLRLGRKLKEVDEDVQRHNELLELLRNTPSEIDKIVARRRKDFTQEFFSHVGAVAASYHDDPEERAAIEGILVTCLAAVRNHDTASEGIENLDAAELKLQDVLNSPSKEAAYRKIDNLAKTNQIDLPMMMMINKAWSDGKETDLTKDEAKESLHYMWMKGISSMQEILPMEVRIVKYLLAIKDPQFLMLELKNAFTPPPLDYDKQDPNILFTTPEELQAFIKKILHAYHTSKNVGFMHETASWFGRPRFVQKLEELENIIQSKFM